MMEVQKFWAIKTLKNRNESKSKRIPRWLVKAANIHAISLAGMIDQPGDFFVRISYQKWFIKR
jgi:hypothetical protein